MSENLHQYMCQYLEKNIDPFKGCLVAALKSKCEYLSLLDQSLGTPMPSDDIRNCELLAHAGLFREEIRLNRDGRNRYKLFFLTDSGRRLATAIEHEGFDGDIPESIPVI